MEIGTVVRMAALTPFSRRVIGSVKAELARRDLDGVALVPVLGLGRNAVYARLRGEKSFEVEEIAMIADFFGIPVEVLVAPQPAEVAA